MVLSVIKTPSKYITSSCNMKATFGEILSPLSNTTGFSGVSPRSTASSRRLSVSHHGHDLGEKENLPDQSNINKVIRRNTIDVPISCNELIPFVDIPKGEGAERRQTIDPIIVDSILNASNHYSESNEKEVDIGFSQEIPIDIQQSGKRAYSARLMIL